MANDFDATKDIILQLPDGSLVWVAEFSAVSRALYLPTGQLDFPEGVGVAGIDAPPPDRVRLAISNGQLVFVGSTGVVTPAAGVSAPVPGQSFTGQPGIFHDEIRFSVASEVQYVRTWLAAGVAISSIRVIQTRAIAAGNFKLGIYDQADPADIADVPQARVAETPSTAQAVADHVVALSTPYTPAVTGYYWLAFVADTLGGGHRWVSTDEMHSALSWLRFEASAGVALPVAAASSAPTGDEIPSPFIAAVE